MVCTINYLKNDNFNFQIRRNQHFCKKIISQHYNEDFFIMLHSNKMREIMMDQTGIQTRVLWKSGYVSAYVYGRCTTNSELNYLGQGSHSPPQWSLPRSYISGFFTWSQLTCQFPREWSWHQIMERNERNNDRPDLNLKPGLLNIYAKSIRCSTNRAIWWLNQSNLYNL